MTHEEKEAYRKQLQEILNKATGAGDNMKKDLQELAREVGASTQTVFLNVVQGGRRVVCDAEIPELSYNIHQALQTASMVNMCEIASKGYDIGVDATRNACWVSVVSTLIALLSAVAAWFAVLRR